MASTSSRARPAATSARTPAKACPGFASRLTRLLDGKYRYTPKKSVAFPLTAEAQTPSSVPQLERLFFRVITHERNDSTTQRQGSSTQNKCAGIPQSRTLLGEVAHWSQ